MRLLLPQERGQRRIQSPLKSPSSPNKTPHGETVSRGGNLGTDYGFMRFRGLPASCWATGCGKPGAIMPATRPMGHTVPGMAEEIQQTRSLSRTFVPDFCRTFDFGLSPDFRFPLFRGHLSPFSHSPRQAAVSSRTWARSRGAMGRNWGGNSVTMATVSPASVMNSTW